jgi:hypothetical protein
MEKIEIKKNFAVWLVEKIRSLREYDIKLKILSKSKFALIGRNKNLIWNVYKIESVLQEVESSDDLDMIKEIFRYHIIENFGLHIGN